MMMSNNLRNHMAVISHNLNGSAQDPQIRYSAYKLILKENFGTLPAQRQLEAAAAMNYPPALIDLALLYLNGRYISNTENGSKMIRDDKKAKELLEQAANQRDPQACLLLAACYCKGIGCEKSELKAEHYINFISTETLRRLFDEPEDDMESRARILDRTIYLLGISPVQMLCTGIGKEKGK